MYLHNELVEIKLLAWTTPSGESYQSRAKKIWAVKRHQPCLCLCLGFSQITLILPFLLMILHFSQIGFTDDLTFTVILLSFVVRLVPPYRIHTSSSLSEKRHYGLPYLYMNTPKKGIIQAFQQSSLEHYNTFILENQAFS